MPEFSHLHVHTQFSLLDGAASIPSLMKKAVNNGMKSIAITDHGNMFGVFEFVAEAAKYKGAIKPIVGCEFYIVADRTKLSFTKDKKDKRYHQLFLAKNEKGYQNLVKLCSLGYIEGLYGKYPRIDKELVMQYHEGLIATTCCIGAMVPQTILSKGEEEAEKEFLWWLNLFGEDYYVELQRHGMPEQEKVNGVLLHFAQKHNVKIIASNDSHYTDKQDANAHDILLCINTGEKQDTPTFKEFADDDVQLRGQRFAFYNDEFYFKTATEMAELFKDIPQAIENTQELTEKVQHLNLNKEIALPFFKVPDNFSSQDDYLENLTYAGAKERYKEITPEIDERLRFELHTIKTMGFAGYFLIVADFVKAGKDMGVFVGPGRGSAAGSAVAYCIGITNIDPVKYNLLFERFLNPDRKSMPDIDTDFDDEGRGKVIDYVVEKYGRSQVAQIVTYGTMAARVSIKDVARVLDRPLNESNELARQVPERPGTELKKILHINLGSTAEVRESGYNKDELEGIKTLQSHYKNKYGNEGKVLHLAETLEGGVRNTGIHASAIIIAPKDITDILPVCKSKDSDLYVTQFEGNIIEQAGVIKMDFLGLKTLTILRDTLRNIKKNHGEEIDLDKIPFDDMEAYKLFQKGETTGFFQFESPGMQKHLKDLKPDKFEDLIAMNALYRPGPMEYIPTYIRRKHGKEPIVYDLPVMKEHLEETYGVTVYQEQVMLLSQKIAGFTKGDADTLRKAMGKKQREVLDKMKDKFISGAKERGHNEKILEKVWKDWEAFAQYAFNKSHSTCYAYVAYQTAWLKAHYTPEYMAAVLSNNMNDIKKITFFMDDCKRLGIKVLGPDINESDSEFAVNKNGEVRFGLAAIKGAGEAAIEAIISERENGKFASLFDFAERMSQRSVNKKIYESLALSGAFDLFSEFHRAQYFVPDLEGTTLTEKVIRYGSNCLGNKVHASSTLFGGTDNMDIAKPKIHPVPKWSGLETLQKEKEVVGFYISGHPLDDFDTEIKYFAQATLDNYKPVVNRFAHIPCIVSKMDIKKSQKGNDYCIFTLEDYTTSQEFRIFNEDCLRLYHLIKEGNVLLVKFTGNDRWGKLPQPEAQVVDIMLLSAAPEKFARSITLRMPVQRITQKLVDDLVFLSKENPGTCDLKFEIFYTEEKITLPMPSTKIKLNPHGDVLSTLNRLDDVEMLLNK